VLLEIFSANRNFTLPTFGGSKPTGEGFVELALRNTIPPESDISVFEYELSIIRSDFKSV